MAFRDAHETAGKVVARAEELKCDLTKLSLQELQKIRYSTQKGESVFGDMKMQQQERKWV